MDILKAIKKINNNFNISKYNEIIFNEKTIKLFSLKILVKYIDYIDEKIIKVALDNPKRFEYVYNDNIYLFCIQLNINLQELFLNNKLSDDMLSSFNIYEIYKEKTPNKFYEFITKNKCRTDRDFNLIDFYKKNRALINKLDLNDKKNIENLNLYFKLFITTESYKIDYKIEKIFELKNIDMIIKKVIKTFILKEELFNSIDFITKVTFDLDYNNFFSKMSDIYKIKYLLPNYYQIIIDNLYGLKKIQDKNQLLEWYFNNEKEFYCFDSIINRAKEISFKDITSSLTPVTSNKETIVLEGQPFNFLVHKLSGYNNYYIGKEINKDISKWDNCNIRDLVLSTSLIDQYYIGMVNDDVPVLGFNNLSFDDVIDIGIDDLYSNHSMYKNNVINPLSRYMLYYDFMLESVNPYNEIVIKRDKDGVAIKPNFLVSFDGITSYEKEISSYFNIPIYNIKTKIYIEGMIAHLNYLLQTQQYKLYLIFFRKMCSSFILNLNAISSYTNVDNLGKILDDILDNVNVNNNLTLEDINTFKAIANSFNFVSNGHELIGSKFIKQLKKIK